jgi:hypothetical protein
MKPTILLLGLSLAAALAVTPANAQFHVVEFRDNPLKNDCNFTIETGPIRIRMTPRKRVNARRVNVRVLSDPHQTPYFPEHDVTDIDGAECSFTHCVYGQSIWLVCVLRGVQTDVEFTP